MLAVGSPAPGFTLPDQDERPVRREDFRGRWLVLYFYPRDNTQGCTVEAQEFTAAREVFAGLDAVIVGVSPDYPAKHRKFIARKDLRLTLLSDTGHEVLERYGVWQLKKMCGRESFGVVRTTYLVDPEGLIAHCWAKVKVNGHVDAVREKLAALRRDTAP